jgi:16S rRNA (cytosine1402-N4)-methyltransferase
VLSAAASGHVPVLLEEAIAGLRVRANGRYLDATFGRGGHAARILGGLGADGRLLLMDRDPAAIAVAERAFGGDARVAIRRGGFDGLAEWDETTEGLDGVLMDLGVSSPQIDDAARGFSFQGDGPLDMRMDPTTGEGAASFLERAGETEIADVLWNLGEERMSRRIARAIVARRAENPLERTRDLAELIASTIGRREPGQHPATRSFQALRIHVNDELGQIERGLRAAVSRLRPAGRLAVISFHSLEDRLVKRYFRDQARSEAPARRGLPPAPGQPAATLALVAGPTRPESAEVARNPRARSAILRVAERLA